MPASAHAPSVRSTDQLRPKTSTQPSAVIARAPGARHGDSKSSGPAVTRWVSAKRVWSAK